MSDTLPGKRIEEPHEPKTIGLPFNTRNKSEYFKRWASYRQGWVEGVLYMNVDEVEKDETPCWVAFPSQEEDTEITIPVCFKEEEAAAWMLRGWDVGYLPRGTAHPEECKWLT